MTTRCPLCGTEDYFVAAPTRYCHQCSVVVERERADAAEKMRTAAEEVAWDRCCGLSTSSCQEAGCYTARRIARDIRALGPAA